MHNFGFLHCIAQVSLLFSLAIELILTHFTLRKAGAYYSLLFAILEFDTHDLSAYSRSCVCGVSQCFHEREKILTNLTRYKRVKRRLAT